MNPHDHTVSETEQATQRLLEKGADTYVHAVTAIVEYRRLMIQKCRKVVSDNLQDYQNALGVAFSEKNIGDHMFPELTNWTGIYAELGIRIKGAVGPPGVNWWASYCCLFWDYRDTDISPLGIYAGVWLPRKLAEALYNKLKPAGMSELKCKGEGVYLQQRLDVKQATEFDKPLENMLLKWIACIKKVQGLKAAVSTDHDG